MTNDHTPSQSKKTLYTIVFIFVAALSLAFMASANSDTPPTTPAPTAVPATSTQATDQQQYGAQEEDSDTIQSNTADAEDQYDDDTSLSTYNNEGDYSSDDTTLDTNDALSNDNYYTNVDDDTVHAPAYSEDNEVPEGATAQCNDGTYSFSEHHSGTCSHHGGVEEWE